MALEEVDFSNDFPSQESKSGDRIPFMKFSDGQNITIRPIGGALKYYKFFLGKGKPSIIVNSKNKETAAKLLSEKLGNEVKPSFKCAMFVIDRTDGQVKILEGGSSIFDAFSNWSKASGSRPGAPEAGDWQIKVTGNGVGGTNPRRYQVVHIGPKPFSEEERAMIMELKDADKLKLANILKETPLEEVVNKALGNEPQPQQQAAAVSSDDLGW